MKYRIAPKRPASIPFTPEGYAAMEQKMADLTEKRKGAIIALRTARDMGDLSENGAYKAARFELSGIDRQLRKLTFQKRYAVVIKAGVSSENVDFGSRITLSDAGNQMNITLVGSFEANPVEGKISITSPLGHALMGKRAGDTIVVSAPAGQRTYTITSIE